MNWITKYLAFDKVSPINKTVPRTMLLLLAALGIMLIGLTITNVPIVYSPLSVYGDDEDDESNDEDDESNDEDDESNDEDDESDDEDDESDDEDDESNSGNDCEGSFVNGICYEGNEPPDYTELNQDNIDDTNQDNIDDTNQDNIDDTNQDNIDDTKRGYTDIAKQDDTTSDSASDSHTKTFKNTPYGISTKYPSDWQIDGTDSNPKDGLTEIAHISPSSGTDERVEIGIDNQTAFGTTLEGYLNFSADAYQNNFGGITVLESDTESTLAGNPAYKMVFTSNDRTIQIMETGFIHGGKVYYVTYIAKPDSYLSYLPDVQSIADSLRISR